MRRFSIVTITLLMAIWPLSWADPTAQSAGSNAAGEWQAPRTPDGQPDLQGDWTNDSYTPLERPVELGDKEFFTQEEAVAFLRSRVDQLLAQPSDDIHYDDAIWQAENYAKQENLRTSLIVSPRDGRVPPITEAARARVAQQRASQRATGSSSSFDTRSLAERCISWGNVGPPMVPPTYYANLEILQSRDQVIIRHELMDGVRVIYLDGRPHPAPQVQWLAGHSVGRWDGQTLVVDTTNFTPKTNFRGSPRSTRQDIFATEALHVVERFTPAGPDTIRYEFFVEDPNTWTSSWSGEMPLRRVEGPLFEYACHEGNYGLANILRGALMAERAGTAAR